MSRFYLIELSYRSIKFLDFLNVSLEIWNSVPSANEKNQKYSLSQKQDIFRHMNNNNLIKYQKNGAKDEDNPKNPNYEKIEIIRKWAQQNNIKSSKDLPFEEINEINNIIYKKYINKLKDLKEKRNKILQLIFPQLSKSLFDSFHLLYEIKTITLKEKNNEIDKYTKLIIDSNSKEKQLKNANETINILNKTIKKEKQSYETKIASMFEQINELNKEKNNLKMEIEEYKNQNEYNPYSDNRSKELADFYNSIFLENEKSKSDIALLTNKIKTLEITAENLTNELNNERTERKKLENELNNERTERKKLENKLNNERTERKKLENELNNERAERMEFQKEMIKSFEDNNNEMMKKLKE